MLHHLACATIQVANLIQYIQVIITETLYHATPLSGCYHTGCKLSSIHTGNYHRQGYIMLHHLAGATIQVANLVQYMQVIITERVISCYTT